MMDFIAVFFERESIFGYSLIICFMIKRIKRLFHALVAERSRRKQYRIFDGKIERELKRLKNRKQLTNEQKREIEDFYVSMIGKKIPLSSHEFFYSRTGYYSKEYVPKGIYTVDLLPKANKVKYRDAYADKNMIDVLLPNVKHPHTVLKRMNGYFYFEGEPVSKEEAIKSCWNISNCIIKPSLEYSGKGVCGLDVENGVTSIDELSIESLFEKYGENFQIQERLKQHERMCLLNPTSVNTIRILTYRSGMEILVVYSVVRIGRMGQVVDNQCAGGISVVIGEDGKLGKSAFGGYTENNVLKTDVGTELNGFEIPSYDKAIETVKKLHFQLPFFNLIGWDVAIDEVGDPVVIEWNVNTGLSQSAFGPGFGKYTERIIRELWPRENSWNRNWK